MMLLEALGNPILNIVMKMFPIFMIWRPAMNSFQITSKILNLKEQT